LPDANALSFEKPNSKPPREGNVKLPTAIKSTSNSYCLFDTERPIAKMWPCFGTILGVIVLLIRGYSREPLFYWVITCLS
jgi:hypothetical protein